MKKVTLLLAVAIATLSTTACRETETKEVVREVEVETKETVEESEGILERAGQKVDEEINEEIDEEIDKIGNNDDN
jgi:hypothetical protein